jgi:hypothetical protein
MAGGRVQRRARPFAFCDHGGGLRLEGGGRAIAAQLGGQLFTTRPGASDPHLLTRTFHRRFPTKRDFGSRLPMKRRQTAARAAANALTVPNTSSASTATASDGRGPLRSGAFAAAKRAHPELFQHFDAARRESRPRQVLEAMHRRVDRHRVGALARREAESDSGRAALGPASLAHVADPEAHSRP